MIEKFVPGFMGAVVVSNEASSTKQVLKILARSRCVS
jgi:hypothetical protein